MVHNLWPSETKIVPESSISSTNYDGIVLVTAPDQHIKSTQLYDVVTEALRYDSALKNEVAVLPLANLPAGRLVHSPTGTVDPDYDDVRIFKQAAKIGIERALKAGVEKPLLVLEEYDRFPDVQLVSILGALEALYVPIQLRELEPSKAQKVSALGVYTPQPEKTKALVQLAGTLENGRRVACDIGDADPERMAPPRAEEYVREVFNNTNVKVTVIKDVEEIAREYPLFEAVNRGASLIERHRGRIVFLEYTPADPAKIEDTVYLVGKGVTYDTGGCDIKAGGVMAGMSRDKCGAAAAAGFMKVVSDLRPAHLKVVAGLSLVRNSVGSNAYVADELIKARSGAKVRVNNTDAEGRMVMADVLCKFKDDALNAVNPHLFTIATLTGHACLAVGPGYSIVLDNGPAKRAKRAEKLQQSGEQIGDPFEISTLRKDDLSFHKGKVESEDISQSNSLPSSRTARGHQGPAGFLLMASGLDKHGSGAQTPIKYSHLDIAASAGDFPYPATGAPVLALAKTFILK